MMALLIFKNVKKNSTKIHFRAEYSFFQNFTKALVLDYINQSTVPQSIFVNTYFKLLQILQWNEIKPLQRVQITVVSLMQHNWKWIEITVAP